MHVMVENILGYEVGTGGRENDGNSESMTVENDDTWKVQQNFEDGSNSATEIGERLEWVRN